MSAHASENSLQGLVCIREAVLYGFDLHSSFDHVINYTCPGRRLVDVVKTAVRDPSHMGECQSIINELINFTKKELTRFITKKSSSIGLSKDEVAEFMERIKMFWEIYSTRDVQGLFSSVELNDLDLSMDLVERTLQESHDLNQDLLPVSFRRYLTKGSPIMMKSLILPLSMKFDDLSSMMFSTSPSEPDVIDPFVEKYELVLSKLSDSKYDFEIMNQLAAFSTAPEFRLEHGKAIDLLERLLPYWNTLLRYTDIRVRDAFMAMLEKFFSLTSTKTKNVIFERIILHNMSDGTNDIPKHEDHLVDFDKLLTESINSLGDHQDLQTNSERFEKIRSKLHWFLLMAPLPTLKRLLSHCVDNKIVVPAALKILHSCSALFSLEDSNGSSGRRPILINILDEIFSESIEKWTNVEAQDSLVYLIASLCRRKRTIIKEKGVDGRILHESYGEVLEDSLIDAAELFSLFVMPKLLSPSAVSHHQIMMLKILQRSFQNLGAKDTVFKWTSEFNDSWKGLRIVPAPELLMFIHTSYLQYEQVNQPIADCCRVILKTLGDKLREDDVVFTTKTSAFILMNLSKDPWWLRYAIITWFSHSLGSPKQQLPSGLFKSLPIEMQEKCEQITVDYESAPVCCMLRSLFEIGLFDVDIAIGLLNNGLDIRPADFNLLEKIALSLSDSCGRSFKAVRIAALTPLIDRVIAILDPSGRAHELEYLSESIFYGLRLVPAILIIAKAAHISYAKIDHWDDNSSSYYPPDSLNRPGDPKIVAEELMQAFCELSKTHMEKEMVSYRRSLLPIPPEIREERTPPAGVEIQRSERVLAQLHLLFSEAVKFTKVEGQTSPSLRVLLTQLVDHLKEVQEKQIGRFLDDVVLESVQSKTVYAYVQQPPKKLDQKTVMVEAMPREVAKETKNFSAPVVASNKDDPIGGKDVGSHFVENELFSAGGFSDTNQPSSSKDDRHSHASPQQKISYYPNQSFGRIHNSNDWTTGRDRLNSSNFSQASSHADHNSFGSSMNRSFRDPQSMNPAERDHWTSQSHRTYNQRNDNVNYARNYRGDTNGNPQRGFREDRRVESYRDGLPKYRDSGYSEQNSFDGGSRVRDQEHQRDDEKRQHNYGSYGAYENRRYAPEKFNAVAGQISNPVVRDQVERRLNEKSGDIRHESGGGNRWNASGNTSQDSWKGHPRADTDSVRSNDSGNSSYRGNKKRGNNKRY